MLLLPFWWIKIIIIIGAKISIMTGKAATMSYNQVLCKFWPFCFYIWILYSPVCAHNSVDFYNVKCIACVIKQRLLITGNVGCCVNLHAVHTCSIDNHRPKVESCNLLKPRRRCEWNSDIANRPMYLMCVYCRGLFV